MKHYATESEQSQTIANQLSQEQLQHEFDYIRAQRILDELLKKGQISLSEFDDTPLPSTSSKGHKFMMILLHRRHTPIV